MPLTRSDTYAQRRLLLRRWLGFLLGGRIRRRNNLFFLFFISINSIVYHSLRAELLFSCWILSFQKQLLLLLPTLNDSICKCGLARNIPASAQISVLLRNYSCRLVNILILPNIALFKQIWWHFCVELATNLWLPMLLLLMFFSLLICGHGLISCFTGRIVILLFFHLNFFFLRI